MTDHIRKDTEYRGPSNEPGLTSREYREMREEEEWAEWDRIERMNDLIWERGR